ncbi:MAG: peptidylprolyl isomerase [Planctomycetes bacterium]|nr:peptidylprolyl isomerase [Planctomycetota bacterium]
MSWSALRARWYVLCFAAVLALAGAGCSGFTGSRSRSGDDPVLAVVGDRTIRRSDLERRIIERFYGKRALLGLIREALFEEEASRLGARVTQAEVDAAVAAELSQTSEELDRRLAQVGLSRQDVEHELRAELRNAILVEKVVRPQRTIGERELQRLYDRTFAVDRVAVRHIAFPFGTAGTPSEEAVRRAAHQAEATLVRLGAGDDFAEVAREESGHPDTARRGGDMGIVSRASPIDPKLLDVIFALEEGELSDPVREVDYGFHIFRVDRRIGTRPLDEVRDLLRRELLETPPTEAEISAVEQILRQRTSVTVYDEAMEPERP